MEKLLSRQPALGFENQNGDLIKVAMTTLAFKNDHLINLLKQRGEAIKNENWDKQLNLDREINDLKNNNFDELISPCSVYMTFETEEGIRRALEHNKSI